ncbi:hypothetical protein ACFLSK_01650 [Chloroflexota bacterium]
MPNESQFHDRYSLFDASYNLWIAGLIFQGIYCYGDWHVMLTSRSLATAGDYFRGEVTTDAGTEVIKARGR